MAFISVFLKGMVMGLADLVPGVSGGTLAFILGIYQRFINALSEIDSRLVKLFFKGEIKACWNKVDAQFLLPLGLGILSSIIVFSYLISFALEHYPLHLFGFFFGLVLASIPFLLSKIGFDNITIWLWLFLGIVLGGLVSIVVPQEFQASALFLLPAGFIAISAMLLPGISGSFLLVLMGVYSVAINSIKEVDIVNIAALSAGAILGLLLFPKGVRYLLAHHYNSTMACVVGIVIGALVKLWPWHAQYQMWSLPAIWGGFTMQNEAVTFLMIIAGLIIGYGLTAVSKGGNHGD